MIADDEAGRKYEEIDEKRKFGAGSDAPFGPVPDGKGSFGSKGETEQGDGSGKEGNGDKGEKAPRQCSKLRSEQSVGRKPVCAASREKVDEQQYLGDGRYEVV